jgi:RHS repeat-associated protein
MMFIPAILSPSNPDPQWVNTAYYHSDGNGNVTELMQTTGLPVAMYQYDPFGNILAIGGLLANENKYRFSSKEWNDNTGLYYYGYRFYSPNLQRWINRDPIQEFGGINLFEFVGNSPLNWTDLFGECDGAAATAGAFAGSGESGAGAAAMRAVAAAPAVAAEAALGSAAFASMLYAAVTGPNNWYETNPNGVNAPPPVVTSPNTLPTSVINSASNPGFRGTPGSTVVGPTTKPYVRPRRFPINRSRLAPPTSLPISREPRSFPRLGASCRWQSADGCGSRPRKRA